MKPSKPPRSAGRLAALALGAGLLGAASCADAAPEAAAPEVQLEPGRFVLAETSWEDVAPAPQPAPGDAWAAPSGGAAARPDEEERLQQGRERWQNLDIAIRGR